MKKRLTLSSAVVLALFMALGASTHAVVTNPVIKTHQFRCQDRNQGLYFLITENDGKLSHGQLYVENIEAATMTVEQAGNDVIKATITGSPGNGTFYLFKSGKVMVATNKNPSRTEVCQASYNYK